MDEIKQLVEKIGGNSSKLVKDNKGALIGALVGYLLIDNQKAQSSVLGAIAGSLLVDKKAKDESDGR